MKPNIAAYFFVLLILFLPLSFAAGSATITSDATIIGSFSISNQSLYTPYPVEPGKYMDMWLRVQYVGMKGNVDNVTCMIDARYPFSFDAVEDSEKFIDTMTPYQEVLLKYKLRVAENAVQGYNTLAFKCKSKDIDWISTDLSFYIQTHEAVLSIDRVESIPDKFHAGDSGRVSIYLTNLADNTLKDITVKLDLSSADIPFAPVNSTIEKGIESLQAKNSSVLTFDVVAMQNAAAETYKIPLTVYYSDDLGKNYTKSTTMALGVQLEQPDIFVAQEQEAYIRNGTKNSITLSIVNRGDTQVKFVVSELQDGDGYQILTPKQGYVGSINSDDSQTISYDLFINTPQSSIRLPVLITFSDVDGNKYATQRFVDINIYSDKEALALGIEQSASIADPIMLALIAVIALYVGYRIITSIFFRKKQ